MEESSQNDHLLGKETQETQHHQKDKDYGEQVKEAKDKLRSQIYKLIGIAFLFSAL